MAAGLLLACARKDAETCSQALQVTRQAALREDFTAASAWREYAYKQCADPGTLAGIDRELSAAQAQVSARQAALQRRRSATRELLKVFLGFVATHRNNPERASSTPSCDPPAPDDPKKDESKERFCAATRSAGSYPMLVRFWAAEPSAVRFTVKLPDATSCEEIGAATTLKTWSVAAVGGKTTARSRCEFSTGPLAGMHAVLSRAVNADLHLFHPSYLDREPSLRPILEGP